MGLDRLEKIVKAINTEASVRPLRGSFVPVDGEIVNFQIEMANSFPALLAVAKAAKAYVDQWPNASTAHANLVFAVAQLEATP